jgi:hypothetical protein
LEWVRHPTVAPALIIGVGTIVAPFFLMQPGMGAGVAASKTPRPNVARLRSLITHAIYGRSGRLCSSASTSLKETLQAGGILSSTPS